jgi:hypothetical protein
MQRISELATYQPPLSAKAIERAIDAEFGAGVGPRERTVGDILATVRPDSSEPWAMDSVSPDEAGLVMPVWQAVIVHTDGRANVLSAAEAKWLIYIRRACPDQPRRAEFSFWQMYLVAREFVLSEARQEHPAAAMAYLAYAPWRGFREAFRYSEAVRTKRVPALLGAAVLMPEHGSPVGAGLEEGDHDQDRPSPIGHERGESQ